MQKRLCLNYAPFILKGCVHLWWPLALKSMENMCPTVEVNNALVIFPGAEKFSVIMDNCYIGLKRVAS